MTKRVIGLGVLVGGLGVLLLAAAGVWEEAEADRRHRGRHHHHGFHSKHHGFHGRHFHGSHRFVGPGFYLAPRAYPYYAYPRYPYYYGGYYHWYAPPAVVVAPPPVVAAPPPTSYVERPTATPYWHYCQDPPGYYPEVQQCPSAWIQVPPRSE